MSIRIGLLALGLIGIGAAAVLAEDVALLPGANSFTEAQAQERVRDAGLSAVSELEKDEGGIWRGTAQKDGKVLRVAIDFKGNVVAE